MVKLHTLKSPISFFLVYKLQTFQDRQYLLCTMLGTKGLFDMLVINNSDGECQLGNKEAVTSHTDNPDKNTTKSEDNFLEAMSQN